jgi:adenine-specific DNA-methyltransferase
MADLRGRRAGHEAMMTPPHYIPIVLTDTCGATDGPTSRAFTRERRRRRKFPCHVTVSKQRRSQTVAVAIGPEFGTVGPELIRDAAKEAVKIADLLVVCGFALDPLAGEEASTLGRLTILQARMNPDLAMGDELLKKTGSGNLFMVFGEPDIEIRPTDDGRLTLEIHGLDVYDPTTGAVRSSSVDDIAAWFLDTDYDGDAFFVRHAYFTGGDEPYDKLRWALKADISDKAWATVNSTVSRPFPRPKSGKIAVKVINHYGDEVLKVFKV